MGWKTNLCTPEGQAPSLHNSGAFKPLFLLGNLDVGRRLVFPLCAILSKGVWAIMIRALYDDTF
ncbi:hypothetical protein EBQ90_05775 [bacterium]|nr:hypothetical protein [bacterium]